MSRAPIDIVRAFLDVWPTGPKPLEQTIRDLFRPDTEWLNMGLSRTVGADAALALGAKFEASMGVCEDHRGNLAYRRRGQCRPNRTDGSPCHVDGREIGALSIAGVFELDDDGKLVRWRDYTDPAAIGAIHGY